MKKEWEIKQLGDISEILYGYTAKASFENIGPKFLRITDIQNNQVDWESVPFCNLSDTDFQKYKLKNVDIVFARTGATTGKSYLIKNPPKSVFASYLIKVHLKNSELLPEFLYLYFQTKKYWDTINSGISGSAQGGFNATKLSQISISFPSIPEQKRIVKILDKVFAAIDTAKDNAQKNLQNSRELFESYLNKSFAPSAGSGQRNPGEERSTEPAEVWEEKKLGEIGITQTGTTPKTSNKENFGDYITFVKPADFNPDGSIKYDTQGLSEIGLKNSRLIGENSILMVCIGATIGKTGFTEKAICCNQQINTLTTKTTYYPKFFYYAMITKSFQEKVIRNSGQATLPIINKTKWSNLAICFPRKRDYQKKLSEKFDELTIETKKLETIYQEKLAYLEELKKSILQKAFNGEL